MRMANHILDKDSMLWTRAVNSTIPSDVFQAGPNASCDSTDSHSWLLHNASQQGHAPPVVARPLEHGDGHTRLWSLNDCAAGLPAAVMAESLNVSFEREAEFNGIGFDSLADFSAVNHVQDVPTSDIYSLPCPPQSNFLVVADSASGTGDKNTHCPGQWPLAPTSTEDHNRASFAYRNTASDTPQATKSNAKSGSVSTPPLSSSDLSCPTCFKSFKKLAELKKHLKVHDRPWACNVCDKSFTYSKDLTRHRVTVHLERHESQQYLCPDSSCKYATLGFVRKDKLSEHYKNMHTGRPGMREFSMGQAGPKIPLTNGRPDVRRTIPRSRSFPEARRSVIDEEPDVRPNVRVKTPPGGGRLSRADQICLPDVSSKTDVKPPIAKPSRRHTLPSIVRTQGECIDAGNGNSAWNTVFKDISTLGTLPQDHPDILHIGTESHGGAKQRRKTHDCEFPDCKSSFVNIHDLRRHQKTIHPARYSNGRPGKVFRCVSDACRKPDKTWNRLDNFKKHLKRKHEGENHEYLIQRAERNIDEDKPGFSFVSGLKLPQKRATDNHAPGPSTSKRPTRHPFPDFVNEESSGDMNGDQSIFSFAWFPDHVSHQPMMIGNSHDRIGYEPFINPSFE